MERRIILSTIGTLGDLYPFIALGQALKSHGFAPVLAVSRSHVDLVKNAGLDAHAIIPSFEELASRFGVADLTDIGKLMEDQNFMIRAIVLGVLEESTEALSAIAEGAVAIVGSIFALAGPIIAEARQIPFVPVILQPMALFSAYDPPIKQGFCTIASAHNGPACRAWNRLCFAVIRRSLRQRYSRSINRVRALHGLSGQRSTPILESECDRPLRLALYSPHFAPPQPDHPLNVQITGFPGYDYTADNSATLEPELRRFLTDGPPPLIFTLGSFAAYVPGNFYQDSIAIANGLGRRAILLTGNDAIASSGNILARNYVPHSMIFPHTAAIIHHGGIGTTGQALHAGKPQLVVPYMGDQRDNAARIARLGVGKALAAKHYSVPRAQAKIANLLADTRLANRARMIAHEIRHEAGAQVAADAIATLLRA